MAFQNSTNAHARPGLFEHARWGEYPRQTHRACGADPGHPERRVLCSHWPLELSDTSHQHRRNYTNLKALWRLHDNVTVRHWAGTSLTAATETAARHGHGHRGSESNSCHWDRCTSRSRPPVPQILRHLKLRCRYLSKNRVCFLLDNF